MRIIIRNGTVFDGTGREPIQRGVIIIEDGRIAAVGEATQFPAHESGATMINAFGCTVLPGIVDTHVHLLLQPFAANVREAETVAWGVGYLTRALRAGVTTIRDLGSRGSPIFALKNGVEKGWFPGPRIITAGSAICMTGGHGHLNGIASEADGIDGVTRLAREQVKAGADLVKMMATGGAGTPGQGAASCQLRLEELQAGVQAAHDGGLPAAAHATGTVGIKNALRAGVDSVEHGVFLDDEAIELLLKKNAILCPTLSAYRRIVEAGPEGGASEFMVRKAKTLVGPHVESFRRAVAAGVTLAFGTDSGVPFHEVGNVVCEMKLWVDAGMRPEQVLVAATRGAAKIVRLDAEIGTLESGKRADIVIVAGNPVETIADMENVRWVLRDGIQVYRDDGRGNTQEA